ncbi:hypothetical protein GCM10007913_22600 [Devosia yakushimensis]|uniref:Uncharacterized protein n=1 Tax=Devosia yakushimensis TaxID=470028 RepID=A0ABQ5UE94_9HYPH|nr:hypothetical protein GCM10007913_22600 [Devosia yakushimensis]
MDGVLTRAMPAHSKPAIRRYIVLLSDDAFSLEINMAKWRRCRAAGGPHSEIYRLPPDGY